MRVIFLYVSSGSDITSATIDVGKAKFITTFMKNDASIKPMEVYIEISDSNIVIDMGERF